MVPENAHLILSTLTIELYHSSSKVVSTLMCVYTLVAKGVITWHGVLLFVCPCVISELYL